MLNIFGLFPVIVTMTMGYSFAVVAISIFLGFLSVYTGYTFSKFMRTNGGYYSYVGKFMGKGLGIFTAFIYFFYSILALPSVILFLVYFSGYVFPGGLPGGIYGEIILSLLFAMAIMAVFKSGFRQTMRFIMILSAMEIAVVLIFTLYVAIFFSTSSVAYTPPSQILGALPFGILAFAGIGSSIFLSEDSVKWKKTVNRSILYSFLALALLMALPAAAISYRMETAAELAYAADPLSLFVQSGTFGRILGMLMMIIAMTSAFNLSLGYLNAFRHAVLKMVSDHIISERYSLFSSNLWITVLAIAMPVVIILEAAAGSYNGFVIITGAVGLAFLLVHSVANSALIRFFTGRHAYLRAAIPVFSTITFIFIILQETMMGGIVKYSAYAVICMVIISAAAVAMKKYVWASSYSKTGFSEASAEFIDRSSEY